MLSKTSKYNFPLELRGGVPGLLLPGAMPHPLVAPALSQEHQHRKERDEKSPE